MIDRNNERVSDVLWSFEDLYTSLSYLKDDIRDLEYMVRRLLSPEGSDEKMEELCHSLTS